MKVAFIPPTGLAYRMIHGDIVMSLAPLAYRNDYLKIIDELYDKNRFIIMDNGANEHCTYTSEDLAARAQHVHANEMVLPDVLREADATFTAASDYLVTRRKIQETLDIKFEPQYMAVVQGRNIEDLYKLVDRYAGEFDIKTLGIPRLLLTHAYQSIRIDIANWIHLTYPGRFQLHFLGASSVWVKEAYYAARYAPHVRSIDTSMPYNYGLRYERLGYWNGQGCTTRKIERAADYFTEDHSSASLATITFNEGVYRTWCKGSNDTPWPTVKSAP